MRLKLAIEPRPFSTWGVTLAALLPKKEWDKIRFECYRDADYKCAICGNVNEQLHAHEVWKFDDKKKIQRLADVQCRCRLCHDVNHFGRSSQVYPRDYQQRLIRHWCKVNGRTRADFEKHLTEIKLINRRRVNYYYIVKVGGRILS